MCTISDTKVTTHIIIDQEADLHLQAADDQPFVQGGVEACAVEHHRLQRDRRENEGDQHAEDGDAVRTASSDDLAEQAGHHGAHQGRERHGDQHRL
jgi:hypothetical protein